MIAIVGDK